MQGRLDASHRIIDSKGTTTEVKVDGGPARPPSHPTLSQHLGPAPSSCRECANCCHDKETGSVRSEENGWAFSREPLPGGRESQGCDMRDGSCISRMHRQSPRYAQRNIDGKGVMASWADARCVGRTGVGGLTSVACGGREEGDSACRPIAASGLSRRPNASKGGEFGRGWVRSTGLHRRPSPRRGASLTDTVRTQTVDAT